MSPVDRSHIDNDNDKAPDAIKALLGKKVRVYSPRDSSRWDGTLASYFERPVIVVTSGGVHGGIHSGGTILPVNYRIEELPPPEVGPCWACHGTGKTVQGVV